MNKFILMLVLLFNGTILLAGEMELCKLNPELFYYSTASVDERLELIEFAVTSNEKFNKRTVPLDYVREVLDIKAEQIQAGYVVKLMQKDCQQALGFYSLRTNPADLATKKIELQLLYIHPEHTRKGLGTKLLKRAMAQAKQLGMQTMHWVSMPESQSFYTKHGAIQTGSEVNLFNPEGKENVILFDLNIK